MPGHAVRKRIRLPGFDYGSPGAYFITICTHHRACLFGSVSDDRLQLSPAGEFVHATWLELQRHSPRADLDAFVVMPDHVHGILVLHGRGTACRAPTSEAYGRPVPGSIPTIVRSFNSAAARGINLLRGTPGAPVWQRGFYEHIIRSPTELSRLRS
ncbi:MAG: transposase [Chloroflexi bacterium]|nr:transposase [Chloroflexota bacterium]